MSQWVEKRVRYAAYVSYATKGEGGGGERVQRSEKTANIGPRKSERQSGDEKGPASGNRNLT